MILSHPFAMPRAPAPPREKRTSELMQVYNCLTCHTWPQWAAVTLFWALDPWDTANRGTCHGLTDAAATDLARGKEAPTERRRGAARCAMPRDQKTIVLLASSAESR